MYGVSLPGFSRHTEKIIIFVWHRGNWKKLLDAGDDQSQGLQLPKAPGVCPYGQEIKILVLLKHILLKKKKDSKVNESKRIIIQNVLSTGSYARK